MKVTIDLACDVPKCPARIHLEIEEISDGKVPTFDYQTIPAFAGWHKASTGRVTCPDHSGHSRKRPEPRPSMLLNGKETAFGAPSISYEDVLELVTGARTWPHLYTVTFTTRSDDRGKRRAGEIIPGASVEFENGMVINAMITGNG